MSHSLGEIDSLARRAARGAGMSWGLAEEAGKATAWLCAHSLLGAETLALLLKQNEERDPLAGNPRPEKDAWRAHSGNLCPIATGAALSDRAIEVSKLSMLQLLRCDMPLLLLPFLASIAQSTGVTIGLGSKIVSAVCSPKGLYLQKTKQDIEASTADVMLTLGAPLQGVHVPKGRRATPTTEALGALSHFADKLHAPETDARRRTGAGEDR